MPDAVRPLKEFESLVRAIRTEHIALRAHPSDFASIVGNRLAAEEMPWRVIQGIFRSNDARPLLRWQQAIDDDDAITAFISGLSSIVGAARPSAILAGTLRGAIHVWDKSLASMTTVEYENGTAHTAPVTQLAFVAGNELLISADADGNCHLWSASDYRRLETFDGHRTEITAIAFDTGRQLLAAGAADGSVRVWQRRGNRQAFLFVGHTAPVASVAFCPDAQHLVSASADGTLRVWETFSGRCLGTLRGHSAEVIGGAFLPTTANQAGDPRILSASRDGLLKLWTREGEAVATLGGHEGPITDMRWFPPASGGSSAVVSASKDGTVRLWNLDLTREDRVFRGHTAAVLQAAPCGRNFSLIVSVDADGSCRLWERAHGNLLREFGVVAGQRARLSVSSDGMLAACVTEDGTLARIDLDLEVATPPPTYVTFDDQGSRLLIGSGRRIRLTDWEAESVENYVTPSFESVTDAFWGGAAYVTTHVDGTLMSWLKDGANIARSSLPSQTTAVAANRDGSILVAAGASGGATAYRREGGTMMPLSTLAPGRAEVNALACAISGLTLLGGEDGTLRLWDPHTGVVSLDVQAHAFPVRDCDISYDGSILLSAASDGGLRVWNADGTMRQNIQAHTASITACWIGSVTNRALTCSQDQTVKLWDLETGRCLETFYGQAPFVSLAVALHRPIAAAADTRGNVTILRILEGFGDEHTIAP
jgi:WD40 repeat protein